MNSGRQEHSLKIMPLLNNYLKEDVMKKFSGILMVLFALCLVLPASAQVNLGVLGGLNLANIDVDPDQDMDWETRTVFGFGGVLDYNMNDFITFRLEPMYLLKGTKVEEGGYKSEFKLAFLEVPVMFKYAFGTGEIKPYVMAGPTIGFLMSSKVEMSYGGESAEEDWKDETTSIEFGLGFGAGVSMPMGNNSIFVEARYALGLTNLNDDPDDTETDIKSKGIQIFVGITFPVGSK